MTQWETVGGVSKPVGLSPGQTAGEVGGAYIERPAGIPQEQTYKPGNLVTEVKSERDAQGRVIRWNLYTYDQYGNLISVGEQRPGSPIVRTPPSQITPEQAGRYNVFQEREYQQERALAVERVQAGIQPAPGPFSLGYVGYGGIYPALELRSQQQQQYPTTLIDYSQQQRAEQYYANLTPFQRGVGLVGASLVDVRGVAGSYIQSKLFEPSEAGYKQRIYELAPRGEGKTLTGAGQFAWRGLTGEVATTGMLAFGVGYGLSALKLSPKVLKGLGYGAVGLQTYSTGKAVYEGRYGEAITETGMFAASLPFVQAGYATKLPLTKMFGTSAASKAAIADYNIQVREGLSSVRPQELRIMSAETHNLLVGERVSYAPRTTIQKMFGGETSYQAAGKQLSISSKMFGTGARAQPELRVLGEQFHNIEVMERVPFEPRTPAMTKMFGRPAQLPAGLELKGEMFHNIDVMERVPSSVKSLSISQKMFGRSEFIKPQKVSVLDIMLVRPQPMYKQITRSPIQTGFRTRSWLKGSYVSDIRSSRAGVLIGITSGLRQDTGQSLTPTMASRYISKTRNDLMTRNILDISSASIQRVSPIQSSATVQQYTPIQAYEQVQKQLSKEMQSTRQRTPILSRERFPEMPVKKFKFPSSSFDLMPARRKRKGKISSFKFPEISKVASPSQIMRNMGGMFAAPKRKRSRKSRRGKR